MAVLNEEIYSVAELAKASGFGQTYLRERIDDGSLKARPFGKRIVKVKGKDFWEWFDARPLKSETTDLSEEESVTDGKSNGPAGRDVVTGATISAFR